MSFHDFAGPEAVAAYEERLRTGYPQRATVVAHIIDQLAALTHQPLRVLELCVGPGVLAEQLLAAFPSLTYAGIDFSDPFLAFASDRLASNAKRVTLVKADLREGAWPQRLASSSHDESGLDAIVTMQSLHDVGDEACIGNIYQQCLPLLNQGGLFLNADLVPEDGQFNPEQPGRLPIETHEQLLVQAGFQQVSCTLRDGNFACCVGKK